MSPTLQHPKSGRTVMVPDDAADFYKEHGWVIPGRAPEKPAEQPDEVVIPEGDPAKAWKVSELTAYAEREGIDLGEATKKDDVLAAITTAREAKAAAAGSAPADGQSTSE